VHLCLYMYTSPQHQYDKLPSPVMLFRITFVKLLCRTTCTAIPNMAYLFLPLRLLALPPGWAPVVFTLLRESVLLSSISKSSPAESVVGVC